MSSSSTGVDNTNASDWIRGLARLTEEPVAPAIQLEPVAASKEEEMLAQALGGKEVKTDALYFLNRLQARIGAIPSGLSIEQLYVLDHSVRKLDDSGPASLAKTEKDALFLTPQTAEIANDHGIKNPDPAEWKGKLIEITHAGAVYKVGLIDLLKQQDAEKALKDRQEEMRAERDREREFLALNSKSAKKSADALDALFKRQHQEKMAQALFAMREFAMDKLSPNEREALRGQERSHEVKSAVGKVAAGAVVASVAGILPAGIIPATAAIGIGMAVHKVMAKHEQDASIAANQTMDGGRRYPSPN